MKIKITRGRSALRFGQECGGQCLAGGERRLVALLDFLVDLLAMDGNFRGRIDANLDKVPLGADDLYDDPAVDHDVFVGLAGKYEHGGVGLSRGIGFSQAAAVRLWMG